MHTKKTSAFVWCAYLVGFERILKGMPHLSSEKVQWLYYATSFSPSRIRNFVSYFIHDTLWAYPSVTQLKKLMLLTLSFYTSFGRRLTSPFFKLQNNRPETGQQELFQRQHWGNFSNEVELINTCHLDLNWTVHVFVVGLSLSVQFFCFVFFFNNNNSWSFHLKATYPCGEMTQKRMCHYYSV